MEKNQYKRKIKVLENLIIVLSFTFDVFSLGKKPDVKDKEKPERTDEGGPASTPSQQPQQQHSSTTPTNFVREKNF